MYGGMTYNEFRGSLPDMILQRFPVGKVRTQKYYGINDVEKDLLLVAKGSGELEVAIPIGELYESYKMDSVGRVYSKVEDALRVMEKNHVEIAEEVEGLRYEKKRRELRLFLCNYGWSRKYLEKVVHFRWLDLAMVIYLEVKGSTQPLPISRRLLQVWDVSPEQVYRDAVHNMRERGYLFCNLCDQLAKIAGSELIRVPREEEQYILSSKQMEYGAGYMVVPGLLKECAKKLGVGQMILVPSSVHEAMLVPVYGNKWITDEDGEELGNMIRDINESAVAREERLAEHAYIYEAAEDRVYML